MKILSPSVPPAQPSQVRRTECVIKIIPYNRNPQVCQDLSHQLIKPTWVKLNKTNNIKIIPELKSMLNQYFDDCYGTSIVCTLFINAHLQNGYKTWFITNWGTMHGLLNCLYGF